MVEIGGGPFFSFVSNFITKPEPFPVKVGNLEFEYPVGMPSGWIDDLHKLRTARRMGVGIPIIKTITIEPRKGNPRPRIIRGNDFLINSMGLPNKGMVWWSRQLRKHRIGRPLVLSVRGETIEEWQELVVEFDKIADVIELNFSCPNTEGGVMDIEESVRILENVLNLSDKLWLKLSPEFSAEENLELVKRVSSSIRGVTLINTVQVEEPRLGNPRKTGGLSGIPIHERLKEQLRVFRKEYPTFGDLPIFATGGVTPVTATKILQEFRAIPFMLTAFLMEGPRTYIRTVERIRNELGGKEIQELLT